MTPRPGQSLGGRPVTETVTPVNMGNRPHCDNGEGVATASPLPSRLKRVGELAGIMLPSASRTTNPSTPNPSSKLLGYYHSSALRTENYFFF